MRNRLGGVKEEPMRRVVIGLIALVLIAALVFSLLNLAPLFGA